MSVLIRIGGSTDTNTRWCRISHDGKQTAGGMKGNILVVCRTSRPQWLGTTIEDPILEASGPVSQAKLVEMQSKDDYTG